jgi:hypothetical protein
MFLLTLTFRVSVVARLHIQPFGSRQDHHVKIETLYFLGVEKLDQH